MANRYMGSDGHHFALLTGPGRIWLQSMPLPVLAGVIGSTCPTATTTTAPRVSPPASGAPSFSATCSSSLPPPRPGGEPSSVQERLMALGGTVSVAPLP